MKNFKKILLINLFVLSFIISPILVFAQTDDFNSGDYLNNNYTGGGGTNTSNGANSSTSSVGVACNLPNKAKIQDLFNYVSCIISKSIIPLIFTLAVAFFVWGVVQYMLASADEHKKEMGKQYMVWGIIALTVMVSVWGLVNLVGNTFGLDTGFIPQVQP